MDGYVSVSGHSPRSAQLLDLGLVIAGVAQDLVAVLADTGRLARAYLFAAIDPDRTRDGQHGVVLERYQYLVLDHLLVVRDVVEDADHAEYQPVAVEDLAPLGERLGRKHL